MTRRFYCANCGKVLNVTRKALPKYATIIDVVDVHECSEEPVDFDLSPIQDTPLPDNKKQKFVQKINELNPLQPKGIFGSISTADLGDRRFEKPAEKYLDKPVKSTAPESIFKLFESMETSVPEHSINDPESEEMPNE